MESERSNSFLNLLSLLFGTLITILITIFVFTSPYLRCMVKRFVRIQLRKWVIDRIFRGADPGIFVSYYRTSLCHLQMVNNETLAKILYDNRSCAFFVDRSFSFLTSSTRQGGYASIDEFREKVPLTTYDDYRPYIDRMMENGEKNLLSSEKIIYYATSSGTTGKIKYLPVCKSMLVEMRTSMRAGLSLIWTMLPTADPPPERRPCQLFSGKKAEMFLRSKDGTSIGPLSQLFSAVSTIPGLRYLISIYHVLAIDLIEEIPDYETSAFVQLVFALAIPDLFCYSTPFASTFLHTIKAMEQSCEEISHCISHADFNYSSIVRKNISDAQLVRKLNRALNDVILEYGGSRYRLERAEHIRKECLRKDVSGLLYRLWPTLVYASTAIGGSFAVYKERLQFYCGERLPLINMPSYAASESFFGSLASIHTDEYFLSPTAVFFEFIREEDIHQAQPKTLLISEIEPGNRYEVVITSAAGLVRYRMGDVISCTRFLNRADDLVPLPAQPEEIPRIPLISIAYRIGSLLDVNGEKTSEQHLIDALERAADQWRHQGLPVHIGDFTAFPKLDTSPARYVIFLELIGELGGRIPQSDVDFEVDRQLGITDTNYQHCRHDGKLDQLTCILVRSGTFSLFLSEKLITDRVSGVQIKPHRLLKNEEHIRFFYEHQLSPNFFKKITNK